MKQDSRSRKWQITINNPAEKGFTHETIKQRIDELSGIIYWCMSDEVGKKATYHTHIYIAAENAIRFSTIKRKFDGAHFEMARGTSAENRDYCFKLGKWQQHRKAETNLTDTHEEYGVMPVERQGARNDLADLYDMIKQGMSNFEILEACPDYMLTLDKIEKVRQTLKENEYKDVFRILETVYIYGKTETGKTRGVMEGHGYSNVYRVTDYDHPFDSYKNQDAIMFEEFNSSLKIHDMLKYLDGYPVELPCRYANKQACFTKVYFTSNIPLEHQYKNVQQEFPEVWRAFLRRIHRVKVYYAADNIAEFDSVTAYLNRHIEKVLKEWDATPVTSKLAFPPLRLASDAESSESEG